jgi:phosphatidylcholine synthase
LQKSEYKERVSQGESTALTDERPYGFGRKLLAWGVHLFTASGFILALLAILAIQKHNWRIVLICLAAALAIDAVDGTMARAFEVKKVLPLVNGAVLDSVSDFLNHVLVPALFLYQSNLVPGRMAFATSAAILLVSAYHWGNKKAVTKDKYIEGFPAMWNMVVVYLFLFNFSQWANLAIVLIFCGLIFVPIKYVYVSQTRDLRLLSRIMTAIWAVLWVAIIAMFPATGAWLIWVSLFYLIYISTLGLYRTFRGPAPAEIDTSPGQ